MHSDLIIVTESAFGFILSHSDSLNLHKIHSDSYLLAQICSDSLRFMKIAFRFKQICSDSLATNSPNSLEVIQINTDLNRIIYKSLKGKGKPSGAKGKREGEKMPFSSLTRHG